MPATIINCALILLGSFFGLLLKNKISRRFTDTITQGLGLCVLGIGITSAIATENTLCVIVCMVLGTLLGEALKIEDRLDTLGDLLKAKFAKEGDSGNFTQGFVTASLLFCIGAMAVVGSIDAGIRGDYSIIISKGVIDGVSAISFAAAMGMGVAFAAVPVLLYQGGLTLLAGVVGGFLSTAVITEMGATGGAIIIGLGINMLELGSRRIKVGNMLPAIFLPLLYLPVSQALIGYFSSHSLFG